MDTKRLFFALWPDDRQRERLRNTLSPVARGLEGDPVLRGNWHVTLAFVGAFPAARLPELAAAAARIAVLPFRLRFDRVEYWPRPRLGVLLAPAVPAELERLVAALNEALAAAGVAVDERPFRPHVTFLKRARPFETARIGQPLDTAWERFELIESVPGPGGSNYRVLPPPR